MYHNRMLTVGLVIGSLLCLVLAVLTVLSFYYSVTWRDQRTIARLWLQRGSVSIVTERLAGPGIIPGPLTTLRPRPPGWSLERIRLGIQWSDLRPRMSPTIGGTWVSVPLWMPLAGFGLALFWVRRRLTRRALPHQCLCGYDLTGNVSGRCPECGTACGDAEVSTHARHNAGLDRRPP
jgi:hypothetical protein